MSEQSDEFDHIKGLLNYSAVPQEAHAEIGRVVTHFALLKIHLSALTHGLLESPERICRIITSELSFRGLKDLSMSLVLELFGGEKVEEFKEVLKKVSRARAKRNRVMHSRWGHGLSKRDDDYVVVRTRYTAKQRKGLTFQREELTVDDLRSIAHDISVATYEVKAFAASIGFSIEIP